MNCCCPGDLLGLAAKDLARVTAGGWWPPTCPTIRWYLVQASLLARC